MIRAMSTSIYELWKGFIPSFHCISRWNLMKYFLSDSEEDLTGTPTLSSCLSLSETLCSPSQVLDLRVSSRVHSEPRAGGPDQRLQRPLDHWGQREPESAHWPRQCVSGEAAESWSLSPVLTKRFCVWMLTSAWSFFFLIAWSQPELCRVSVYSSSNKSLVCVTSLALC